MQKKNRKAFIDKRLRIIKKDEKMENPMKREKGNEKPEENLIKIWSVKDLTEMVSLKHEERSIAYTLTGHLSD